MKKEIIHIDNPSPELLKFLREEQIRASEFQNARSIKIGDKFNYGNPPHEHEVVDIKYVTYKISQTIKTAKFLCSSIFNTEELIEVSWVDILTNKLI